jgi:hypothetical protein
VQAERAGEKDRQWLAAELLPMQESENEHILRQREAGEYDRLLDLVRQPRIRPAISFSPFRIRLRWTRARRERSFLIMMASRLVGERR